jgi:hypothetical protein
MTPFDPAHSEEDVHLAPSLKIMGTPGPFTEWGITLVRGILAASGHTAAFEPLAMAAPAWLLTDPAREQSGAGGERAVLFLSPVQNSVDQLIRLHADAIAATRDLTAALAALIAARNDETLIIEARPEMELAAIHRAVAAHILGATAETAPAAEAMPAPPTEIVALQGQAQLLSRQVLAPMLAMLAGDRAARIIWPLSCFYSGDAPGEMASAIIETAGPARILLYGPYFCLPPGRWQADFQIFFSNDLPDAPFAAEILAGAQATRVEFRPSRGGLFQGTMQITIEQASDPVEFRLWLLRSAFFGQVGLRQVTWRPLDAA